jgi:WD40 repeat protein
MAFTPDGRQIFLAATDNTIRLWDLEAGREVRSFAGHAARVQALAVSADGRRLFSGGGTVFIEAARVRTNRDCGARLWDVAGGRELAHFETPDPVRAVAIAPDGRYGLAGGEGQVVRLWDLPGDGAPPAGEPPGVRGGGEKPAPAPPAEERRFEGHSGRVTCLAVSPNGRHLLTGGEDRSVRLWDLATGKELKRFTGHEGSGAIRSVAFSADSQKAASADANGQEFVWGVENLQIHRSLHVGGNPAIEGAAFAPDGQSVLLGAGTTLFFQELGEGGKLHGHVCRHGAIHGVAWSHDGSVAALGEAAGSVRLWDPFVRKEVGILPVHKGAVLSVAFAPKTFLLLSAGDDRDVVVWDVKMGVLRRRLKGHNGRVRSVAFSPDGQLAVSGSQDTTVRVWNLKTRQEAKRFLGHKEEVRGVAFTPDGRQVISCGDGIKVWDLPAELRPRKPAP